MQYRYDTSANQSRSSVRCDCADAQVQTCRVLSPFPNETPIAMAYVPYQQTPEVYDEMKAFCRGTLFPDLDKPFEGCMK